MVAKPRILLFDPQDRFGKEIIRILGGIHFSVRLQDRADLLLRMMREFDPQVIVVGVGRADDAGHQMMRQLAKRQRGPGFAIIAVLAEASESLEILAFEAGADSILTTPFNRRALPLRLQSLTQRLALRLGAYRLEVGPLVVDRRDYSVQYAGMPVALGRREFELLYVLAKNPGKLFTRAELLENIVGHDAPHSTRTIDVHICNLREKLAPGLIHTFKGKGYQLRPEAALVLAS